MTFGLEEVADEHINEKVGLKLCWSSGKNLNLSRIGSIKMFKLGAGSPAS